jgi:hypothetical protein
MDDAQTETALRKAILMDKDPAQVLRLLPDALTTTKQVAG